MNKVKLSGVVRQDGRWYIAECNELGVASQGKNITEAVQNLKEACELYLDDYPENTGRDNKVVFTKLEELPPEI
jgi:predicted RNase H-like HicB family nuclease